MRLRGLNGKNLVAITLLGVVIVAVGYSYFAFGTGALVVRMTDPVQPG